ncbi:MAG: hypothetical protein ABI396_12260 [Ktedonobacteraceae bacterium]
MSGQDQNPGSNDDANQNPNQQNQATGTPLEQTPSTGDASQNPPSASQPPAQSSSDNPSAPGGGSGGDQTQGSGGTPIPVNLPPQHDDASGGNTLLSDKTFQALHDAFLLGWNLLELRSRVLLAALDVKFQRANNQIAAFDLVDAVLDTLLPESTDKDADQLAMLPTSRPGLLNSDPFAKLPVEPSDAVWNTSVWRAMFNRIVGLQIKLVTTNDTTGTIYEVAIPAQDASSNATSPYSYLYIPKNDTDLFTSIGISSSDVMSNSLPSSYELYGITRRVLNCLTQLYVRPNEVLDPQRIKANRDKIVPVILGAAPAIIPEDKGANSPHDVLVAIKRYTGLTVRFLEAWDGYVRESLYVGQNFENYEIAMVAYEAGRALCTLSWGVALFVVPLENALDALKDDNTEAGHSQQKVLMHKLYSAWQSVFNPRDIIHIQHQISALSSSMDGAYYRIKVANQNAQNQSYGPPYGPTNQPYGPMNPDEEDDCLPSNALNSIKHSLDYWQAAVVWIGGPRAQETICRAHTVEYREDAPSMMSRELSCQLRIALIEQADVWQSLITGQQNLRSITTEAVTESILSQFMQDCEKAFISDVTDDVKTEVEQVKKNTEQLLWRNRVLLTVLIGIAVIVLILFVAAEVIAFLSQSQFANSWLGNAIITLASFLGIGMVVHRTTQAQSFSTGANTGQPSPQTSTFNSSVSSSSMLDNIRGFFVSSGTGIGDLFSACRREIQKQYNDLNRNASVSYPLIEVFVTNSQPQSTEKKEEKKENSKPSLYDFGMNNSYSFLTSVIWTNQDRAEEIQSIVQATFGPLGEMIGSYGARFHQQDGGGPPQS